MSGPLLTPRDRALLESLARDPRAAMGYELSKGILLWSDETPKGLSPEGAWVLIRLQAYRSMMYRPEHWRTATTRDWFERCRRDWDEAQAIGLRWIGFHASRIDPANLKHLLRLEAEEFGDL